MTKKVAVIGTGAAGLTAAAHLSKQGFDVVGFEQAPYVGGLLHPFVREGYEFDPGVHYLGRCGPGEQTGREFERLGLDPAALFAPMDDDFDTYRFPDFEVTMCKGVDAYRERLHGAFPGDAKGVDRVMDAVEHLDAALSLQRPGRHAIREYFDALGGIGLVRWMSATFGDYLDWACEDDDLKAVFAAPCGDYGLPPARGSAAMGLAIISHYINGAYFPKGGAGALRDAILGVATDHGATFHPDTSVSSIEVVDGRATAILTADATRHVVDGVVAAIDPRHVYGRLLDQAHVPAKITGRLPTMESSLSACVLYLGLNHDLQERGWGARNVWHYPTTDIDAVYASWFNAELADELFFFISPNSLKDPTGAMAPEGGSTVEVLTSGPWEMFQKWEHVPPGERGPEFKELKNRITAQIMSQLEATYPELTMGVEVCELATPLSFRHYVQAIDGGLYGPAQTPEQSMNHRFSPATAIDGLVLAGQGVFGCGVSTAVMSGRLAALIVSKQLAS